VTIYKLNCFCNCSALNYFIKNGKSQFTYFESFATLWAFNFVHIDPPFLMALEMLLCINRFEKLIQDALNLFFGFKYAL